MEVLTALRRRWPDTEVIVLTAHASLESSVEALRRGAHDYLFKPCKTVELRESVRTALLKRRQNLRQRALLLQLKDSLSRNLEEIESAVVETADEALPSIDEAGAEEARFLERHGLIVDMMRHVITLEGHVLELSPTEFNVLAYLVSQAPRVVSPQELVRQIHGYVSETWEARDLVRSHVHHIRQKIQAVTGCADILQTVRGVGYRIGR
jgi:DNA-binding response OmpR family regulator